MHRPEAVLGGWGEGRDAVQLTTKKKRRAGQKRLVSPYGGNAIALEKIMSGLLRDVCIFEQNGENWDFAHVEKTANVLMDSQFCRAEVESFWTVKFMKFERLGSCEFRTPRFFNWELK